MSRTWLARRRTLERFPRVSGDEPDAATDFIRWTLFSPRERG